MATLQRMQKNAVGCHQHAPQTLPRRRHFDDVQKPHVTRAVNVGMIFPIAKSKMTRVFGQLFEDKRDGHLFIKPSKPFFGCDRHGKLYPLPAASSIFSCNRPLLMQSI